MVPSRLSRLSSQLSRLSRLSPLASRLVPSKTDTSTPALKLPDVVGVEIRRLPIGTAERDAHRELQLLGRCALDDEILLEILLEILEIGAPRRHRRLVRL